VNTLTEIIKVLRALITAAFATGGINEPTHTTLHGVLDGIDPAVAEAKAQAEAGLTPEEQAELDRLAAKQAAARETAAPAGGTEADGFSG
jgi:hypothetical protein